MEMYLGIIIDLLLILCIVLFIVRTAKKGFALSLFNIIAFFGAFILAAIIAKNLSGYIFNWFFEQSVVDKIGASSTPLFSGSTSEEVNKFVFTEFPTLFNFSSISGIGINSSALTGSTSTSPHFVSNVIIEPIFESFISLFVYIIALAICIPTLRFIAKKLSKIFTVSLVGKINSILGGFLGIIKGVAIVFSICAGLIVVMGLFIDPESPLTYGIQNSFIISYVSSIIL